MKNKALRYNKGKVQWHLVNLKVLEPFVGVNNFIPIFDEQ